MPQPSEARPTQCQLRSTRPKNRAQWRCLWRSWLRPCCTKGPRGGRTCGSHFSGDQPSRAARRLESGPAVRKRDDFGALFFAGRHRSMTGPRSSIIGCAGRPRRRRPSNGRQRRTSSFHSNTYVTCYYFWVGHIFDRRLPGHNRLAKGPPPPVVAPCVQRAALRVHGPKGTAPTEAKMIVSRGRDPV
jgi:hypothetical protein